jgi:hypothetical protein
MGWSDPNTQDLLDQVCTNESVYGIPFVLDDEMIANVLVQANKEEHGLKIQSKWDPNARAAPVVPIPPDLCRRKTCLRAEMHWDLWVLTL